MCYTHGKREINFPAWVRGKYDLAGEGPVMGSLYTQEIFYFIFMLSISLSSLSTGGITTPHQLQRDKVPPLIKPADFCSRRADEKDKYST
jgi:hypothetical protein